MMLSVTIVLTLQPVKGGIRFMNRVAVGDVFHGDKKDPGRKCPKFLEIDAAL